jgi:LPXTG-motif cell wall-anchored protein
MGTVQWAVTYLLQEPVKEAVREALREENGEITAEEPSSREESPTAEDSGPSALAIGLGLAVVGGLVYYLRRRQQSTSDWSAETESTPEYAGGETADSHGESDDSGGQTTSVSDQ